MKIEEVQRDKQLGENTLPMINIIFLLLVFFMLAGTVEKALMVSPPESESKNNEKLHEFKIEVTTDGKLFYQGQAIDRATLADVISTQNTSPQQSTQIQLIADADLPAKELQHLFVILANTNIETVHVITKKP